jgi:uncharacterized membrane protein YadS
MSWVTFLLLAFGLLNAWLGYLIRYRREYGLMAGFDLTRVRDPQRLARWVGGCSMVMGAACVAAGISMLTWPNRAPELRQAIAIVVIASLLALFIGGQRRTRER